MKKLISILMILMVCISLVACTQNSQFDENGNPIKPTNKSEDVTLENTNFASGGYVTYANGTSYFVNHTEDKDENDVYQIVRIGDDKNDTPVVIYEVPTTGGEGYYYQTINRIMMCNDRICFFETDNDGIQHLKWVSIDGKKNGVLVENIFNKKKNEGVSSSEGAETATITPTISSYEGKYLYLTYAMGDYTIRYDLSDGTSKIYDNTSIHAQSQNQMFRVLGIYKENIYYIKGDPDGNVNNGIYYSSIVKPDEKELCSIDIENSDGLMLMQFCNDWLFYPSEQSSFGGNKSIVLYGIDLATGEKHTVCTYTDGYGMDFIVSDNKVFYFSGSSIWTCNLDGNENKVLIDDPLSDNRKSWLQVSDNWIFYGEMDNQVEFYRVAKEGKIFPANPICNNE